jgi:hypothetical protein
MKSLDDIVECLTNTHESYHSCKWNFHVKCDLPLLW